VKRRRFIVVAVGALASAPAVAQQQFARTQDVRPLIAKLTRGKPTQEGGIELELPAIAENGNAVPLRVKVESPMREEDHVDAIHIIADRNPRSLVASFHLGPESGRAEVNTRIRLAGSQRLTVVAELSGERYRILHQDVLVTSAACLDDSL
jgi:sulfur-oxidizing protein SoxY